MRQKETPKTGRDVWRPSAGHALLFNTKSGKPFDAKLKNLELYEPELQSGEFVDITTPEKLASARELLRQRGIYIPELNGGNTAKPARAAKTSTHNPPEQKGPPKPPAKKTADKKATAKAGK